MANHFVFNITPEHATLNQENIQLDNFDKILKVKANDTFVTLDKNDEYVFNYYGKISGDIVTTEIQLNDKDRKKKKGKKYRHSIPISLQNLNEKLDDYQYSLIAIHNHKNPYVHFRRKYTILSDEDYKTITKRLIYLSRTTFGRLYNCMPIDNQLDSILSMFNEFEMTDLKEIGFPKAIKFLKKYIDENIVETGRYITAIKIILDTDLKHFDLSQKLCFSSEEGKSKLQINKQAILFEELFNLKINLSLVDRLEEEISLNNESENRFDKLFNKRTWPVNVRI
jgi:hypothetical protein